MSQGGGLAKDMFVRIKTAFDDGQRVSAETYMNNAHLPMAQRVRVALLLVGELSKSEQYMRTIITMRCVGLSAPLYSVNNQ